MAEPTFGFADLLDQEVPPEETAQLLDADEAQQDVGTLDGAMVPGTGSDTTLTLEDDNKAKLARELCSILESHDEMMADRWERDRLIEDAYSMSELPATTGTYPGAAQMVSEMTMSAVDQANARISSSFLGVQPIMEVSPIETSTFAGDLATETAQAAQDFLENYSRDVLKIEEKIPLITLRCTKIGTTVLYVNWKERKETFKLYNQNGKITEKTRDLSGASIDMVRNQDAILWPPWIQDWQEDYEIVGHRTQLTVSQWRVKANTLELTEDVTERVEKFSRGESLTDDKTDALGREGIDASVTNQDEGLVSITELWCNRLLPGEDLPQRFQVFLHEGLREILWIDHNRFHSQKHPYFPIRYKKVDGSAWGTGLGHEIWACQIADTAFRNLELDNLMSLAFVMILLKSGTTADAIMDKAYPGMRVATEDPAGDVKALSLATEGSAALTLLYQAISANELRKVNASGLAAVLGGQGDPTMKSGAGTGSTMALIEQAGKKFGFVDQSIRADWTGVCGMILDLVAQFASDGVYYTKATDEHARTLKMLRYIPVQGSVSDNFRIRAHAPSASNNKEIAKQNLLVVDQFTTQKIDAMIALAQQYYSTENPAGMAPFIYECLETLRVMGESLVEAQEIPGMKGLLPKVLPPTPEQEQINQLMQQIQTLQGQLQSMQQAQMPPQAPPQPGMEQMPPDQMAMPGMA